MVKVIATAIAALIAGMMVEGARARADEVFVCEGGRLVRARAGEVELLKRTDECIARYFGRSVADVETSLDVIQAARAAALRPRAGMTTGGVAVERVSTGDAADTRGAIGDAGLPSAAVPEGPKLPSDHRNVVLLNAAPGNSPYFILGR